MMMKKAFIPLSVLALGALGGALLSFGHTPHVMADSQSHIPTTITYGQAMAKLKHVPNALTHKDGANAGFTFKTAVHDPKVDISEIIKRLGNSIYLRAAGEVQVEYTDMSGIYVASVDPKLLQDDTSIQINGDKLRDVPVWLLSCTNMHLPLASHTGPSSNAQTWTLIFDANDGEYLGSYVSVPNQ